LVSFFAGAGLLVIGMIEKNESMDWNSFHNGYIPFGIELVAIVLGFLLYFAITRVRKN